MAIGLQLGYADRTGDLPCPWAGRGSCLRPFHQWDRSVGGQVGQFVEARSTGLYVNPNELGLWAAICCDPRLDNARPTDSAGIGLTLAVLTLVLSQSRGAMVALLVALGVAAAVYALADGDCLRRASAPVPSRVRPRRDAHRCGWPSW